MSAEPQVSAPSKTPCPAYWTIEQFSAFVGVPKKTVYKWPAQYPTLPVLAMGTGKRRTWLFPIERVQKWLRDQEQGRPSRERVHSNGKSRTSVMTSSGCADACAEEPP